MDAPFAALKNVLVVDDDPGVLRVVARLLAGRFEVRTAEDADTALRMALAKRPDLVLMDVHFRGTDGMTALRELTRFDPDLRVVMLSGDHSPETVDQAMRCGAVAYVTKPVAADEVRDMVDHAIALPRSGRS
ncbi:MAG: response regulator [Elusimicrobia bacterium]|nr:response regulator [Elusimicrobiota bacterium]